MGGLRKAHPPPVFSWAIASGILRVVGGRGGGEGDFAAVVGRVKRLLSMLHRGVVDHVVVTNRVRLLARPIVACWSHLMARCHGGARAERRRVVHA